MHRQHHPTTNLPQARLRPSTREEDLNTLLAAGWLALADLHRDEQHLATGFYLDGAAHRQRLADVQREAVATCQEWTGQWAHPMGSSYAGTALPDSDIDLYAPMPPQCATLDELRALLERKATYEKTRLGPTGKPRHLFTFREGPVKIDLNFVEREDHQLALTVVREIAAALDWADRVAHTWIKHLLRQRENHDAYDHWKAAMRLRCSPTLRQLMANTSAAQHDPHAA